MTSTTLTKQLGARAGALAAGVALSAILAGSAMAGPALIYDIGGKFDKSFNESAFNGATAYTKETGIAFQDLELQDETQREQDLRKFATAGASPIMVMGFNWANALTTVAAEFPKVHFAIVDAVVDAPNVRSVVFEEHTGSYLVGALAAMKSTTGKVGFVGGMDIPLIHKFFCGYKQGVLAVNPKAEVFENYTGTTGAAWNDPTTAGELAKADYSRGADIVYAAAGASGMGVLQAASDEKKLSIGVDSNQNYLFPGSVLTSMVKHVDVAVQQAFKDDAGGKWTSGVQILGLGQGGVGWALDDNNKALVTADMKTKLDDFSKKIVAGDIKVHDYTTDSTCPS